MGKSAGQEEPSTTFLDKSLLFRETQLSEMGKISFCMIATALVVSLGPNAEVKAKKCRKPWGFPGDLAKCNVKGKWERDDPLKKIEKTVIENGEKLDELMKGVSGEKKCAMVVLGDAYSGFQQTSFSPYHVVTNEEDWYNVLNFVLENEVETKVVRFQVDSFFQWGGGLQYFSTY